MNSELRELKREFQFPAQKSKFERMFPEGERFKCEDLFGSPQWFERVDLICDTEESRFGKSREKVVQVQFESSGAGTIQQTVFRESLSSSMKVRKDLQSVTGRIDGETPETMNEDLEFEPLEGSATVGWSTDVTYQVDSTTPYDRTVNGRVQGRWGVQKFGGNVYYKLTYLPVGMAVGKSFDRLRDAQRAAKKLDIAIGFESAHTVIEDYALFTALLKQVS